MKVVTHDRLGKVDEVIVEATDAGFTVPIRSIVGSIDVVANVYTYTWEDKSLDVPPFFGFIKNKLIFFCNDVNYVNENPYYAYHQFSLYVAQLRKFQYSNNFSQYNIKGDVYKINWILDKKFHYEFAKKGYELFVYWDGTKSRFQIMHRILKDIYEADIKEYIRDEMKEMDIYDKAIKCDVTDCVEGTNRYADETPCETDPVNAGVLGTNYQTKFRINRQTLLPYDSKNIAVIYFSTFIYFQIPLAQKMLIIHEFVHTKLGCGHSHDSVFWHVFEYYSGYSRDVDCSWSEEIEANDNKKFDELTRFYLYGDPNSTDWQQVKGLMQDYKGKDVATLLKIYKKQYPITKELKKSAEKF